MTLLQILTLLVPIVAAVAVGVITYFYAIKSKKFDLLYASKIPAFKEIAAKLTDYKSFCWGRVAYFQGNEFSPYYNAELGALSHRIEIAKATDANAIFLSKSNRDEITKLLDSMSILCNLELQLAGKPADTDDHKDLYQQSAEQTEKLIELLYNDLNLK